jgi:hypothetical protein
MTEKSSITSEALAGPDGCGEGDEVDGRGGGAGATGLSLQVAATMASDNAPRATGFRTFVIGPPSAELRGDRSVVLSW